MVMLEKIKMNKKILYAVKYGVTANNIQITEAQLSDYYYSNLGLENYRHY